MKWVNRGRWMASMGVMVVAFTMFGCPKTPKTATHVAPLAEPSVQATTPPPAEEAVPPPVVAEERRPEVPPAPAEPETLVDVYFTFDRSEITLVARARLEHMADWLLRNSRVTVRIEGHADARGTNEYNLVLGERRAEAVKRVLLALGVPAERLSTVSYGEEQPVCRGHQESCWQQNRRAHLAVHEGQAP